MRQAKRVWITDGSPRRYNSESYKIYKQCKCDFRKEKRKAERQWNRKKYFDISVASEVDIGELYRTVKRQR